MFGKGKYQGRCPHLKPAHGELSYSEEPAEEQRCFLQEGEGERIDLAHQQLFCLSDAHVSCPWLSFAPAPTSRLGAPASSLALASVGRLVRWTVGENGWLRGRQAIALHAKARLDSEGPAPLPPMEEDGDKSLTDEMDSVPQAEPEVAVAAAENHAARELVTAADASERAAETVAAIATGLPTSEATVIAAPPTSEAQPAQGFPLAATLEAGIAAFNQGQFDRARAVFVSLTEVAPEVEEVWLWRARTALDVPELVRCLERVVEVNPLNQRAQQELDSARLRLRHELETVPQAQEKPAARAAKKESSLPSPGIAPRAAIFMAALASLALAAYWLAGSLLPLFEKHVPSFAQEALAYLPSFVQSYPLSDVPFYRYVDFVPDFNLIQAAPFLVGVMFFLAADGLFLRERVSILWLLIAVAGQAAFIYTYLAPDAGWSIIALSAGIVVVLTASAAWNGLAPKASRGGAHFTQWAPLSR